MDTQAYRQIVIKTRFRKHAEACRELVTPKTNMSEGPCGQEPRIHRLVQNLLNFIKKDCV